MISSEIIMSKDSLIQALRIYKITKWLNFGKKKRWIGLNVQFIELDGDNATLIPSLG